MTFEEWYSLYAPPEDFDNRHAQLSMAETAWNAALLVAANKCYESDGWDMHPKDYGKLVESCRHKRSNAAVERPAD